MIFHSLFLDFSLRAELPNSPKKALPQRIFLWASKLSKRGPCTSGSAVGFPAPRLRAPLQPQFGKSQTRKFTLATALGFPKLRFGLQKNRGFRSRKDLPAQLLKLKISEPKSRSKAVQFKREPQSQQNKKAPRKAGELPSVLGGFTLPGGRAIPRCPFCRSAAFLR